MILSDYSEDKIMGYTPDQLDWVMTNEKEIWNFLFPRNCFIVLTQS